MQRRNQAKDEGFERSQMHILADATLPSLHEAFPPPFKLTTYQTTTELKAALSKHNILLCRSTLSVNAALLQHHRLDYLLTASSGRDHIDERALGSTIILDAKGANASAVRDYVLSCLAYLDWYHDFKPQTVGIIGFGEVGKQVYAKLHALGLTLFLNDPIQAEQQTTFKHMPLSQIARCDLVCIHPNLHREAPHPSYRLIDANFLKSRTPEQAIINASRGDIVDEGALIQDHKGLYCTDVFSNEPKINLEVIKHTTLCTPHIAGHTVEAKINIIRLLSQKLHQCYKLPPPVFSSHPHITTPLYEEKLRSECRTHPMLDSKDLSFSSWQYRALACYHPIFESRMMKASASPEKTFLELRRQHDRHGFDYCL